MNYQEIMNSSSIDAISHENNKLYVRFHGGATYAYEGVSSELFNNMLYAESVGKFLNAEIKPNFPFERL